ncbi:MAG: hypothetical protein ACI30O_04535 [Muribaculaceae bacterium]
MMRRYLSRNVIFNGIPICGLTLVAVHSNGLITHEPFRAETAGTAFVDGSIIVNGDNIEIVPRSAENDSHQPNLFHQK